MARPGTPAAARRRFVALSAHLCAPTPTPTTSSPSADDPLYRSPVLDGPFVAKPYVQLSTAGAAPDGREQLTVMWHTLAVSEPRAINLGRVGGGLGASTG